MPKISTWMVPTPRKKINATVEIPGSKSQSARVLVLAAISSSPENPCVITGILRSRDTDLMLAGLAKLGLQYEWIPNICNDTDEQENSYLSNKSSSVQGKANISLAAPTVVPLPYAKSKCPNSVAQPNSNNDHFSDHSTALSIKIFGGIGENFESRAVDNFPNVASTPPSQTRAIETNNEITIECGQAGTVLRFLPPVSLFRNGKTTFFVDKVSIHRPYKPLLEAICTIDERYVKINPLPDAHLFPADLCCSSNLNTSGTAEADPCLSIPPANPQEDFPDISGINGSNESPTVILENLNEIPLFSIFGDSEISNNRRQNTNPNNTDHHNTDSHNTDFCRENSSLPLEIKIDSSSSSQFLSALLLSAPKFNRETIILTTGTIPSVPHVQMTLAEMRRFSATVSELPASSLPNNCSSGYQVKPGYTAPNHVVIEPDLSNAGPFLAAALISQGRIRIPNWPIKTTQVGDQWRKFISDLGGTVNLTLNDGQETGCLEVSGDKLPLRALNLDLSHAGELVPTLAALALFADAPSTFTGISHLRGHETDRLQALCDEIRKLGGRCEQLTDGIKIWPLITNDGLSLHYDDSSPRLNLKEVIPRSPIHISSYSDHRMAMFAALVGIKIPGIILDDISCTSKTFPGFAQLWEQMCTQSEE